MSKASVERGAVSDFGIPRSGKSGGFRWRWRLRTVKTRLTLAFRDGQAYVVARSESIMEIPAKMSLKRFAFCADFLSSCRLALVGVYCEIAFIGKKDRLFLFMLCKSCMGISTVPAAIQERIVQPPKFELVG